MRQKCKQHPRWQQLLVKKKPKKPGRECVQQNLYWKRSISDGEGGRGWGVGGGEGGGGEGGRGRGEKGRREGDFKIRISLFGGLQKAEFCLEAEKFPPPPWLWPWRGGRWKSWCRRTRSRETWWWSGGRGSDSWAAGWSAAPGTPRTPAQWTPGTAGRGWLQTQVTPVSGVVHLPWLLSNLCLKQLISCHFYGTTT